MNDANKNITVNQFMLKSGETLGDVVISYQTFGTLNADRSNAVLICHSLSSSAHVCKKDESDRSGWWDCIVGSGKFIDTDHYFVICVNNLGGCFGTTGPASMNPATQQVYGHEFPRISINDIVRSHRYVVDHLNITALHAVVGSSMGGMIALEWAIAHPEMVKRLVSISSCSEPPASVIAAHTIQRDILNLHQCNSVDVNCPECKSSFIAARKVGLLTYKSAKNMNERFSKDSKEVDAYMNYNAQKFANDFNRSSYLTFINAMDDYQPRHQHFSFDRITAKCLIVSVDTDVLFPMESQEALYQDIKKYNQATYLINHRSPYGHDAFFKDEIIGAHLQKFINDPLDEEVSIRHDGGILSTIGNTPLVNLSKIRESHQLNFNIYAKLESFNPGGSVKDRPAKAILLDAYEKGLITRDTTIIEYSSGNMGIGLSQACCYMGLKFICVIDPKTTDKTRQIMEAYGTQILCIKEPDPETNEFLPAAINKIKQILKMMPNTYWINQHGNMANASSHYTTFKEIHRELKRIDYLFCATSTCGTIRGCSEYIKDNELTTKIIAVDALGSSIFSNHKQKRIISGHGAGLVPGILRRELIDDVVFTTAEQAIFGARHLLDCEAILAGGSTGAVLSAIIAYADRIPAGSQCVMISADRGERYLDTIYSDAWCRQHQININERGVALNER